MNKELRKEIEFLENKNTEGETIEINEAFFLKLVQIRAYVGDIKSALKEKASNDAVLSRDIEKYYESFKYFATITTDGSWTVTTDCSEQIEAILYGVYLRVWLQSNKDQKNQMPACLEEFTNNELTELKGQWY